MNYSDDEIIRKDKHQGDERFEVRNKHYGLSKHDSLSKYKSALGQSLYSSMFKFSTIRNPWERLISLYFSPNRGEWSKDGKLIAGVTWDRDKLIHMLKTKLVSMETYIAIEPYNSVESTLDRDLDYVIRFEHIDAYFKILCRHIDITYTKLSKFNSSTRQHYSKYYDSELKLLVEKICRKDIEHGDYVFENA